MYARVCSLGQRSTAALQLLLAAASHCRLQINPDDAFGQQMMLNLELRGCPLLGLAQCKDLAAQKERLAACGWSRTEARSLDDIYSCV